LCLATIPHIFPIKFKKVKHATPRNKWSVCWSSLSVTYLSPLEGHCFSRSSAYQWVRIVPSSRRSWYIAAYIWKIYDFKIEVVPLIINFSTELTTVVKFEGRNIFRLCRDDDKRCIFI
jgi:hypothetical protein